MSHLLVAVAGLLVGGGLGLLAARRAGAARLEALHQSRAMLRLVLDTIPQGVFWKDRQSRYLGCNPVVARAMNLAGPAGIVGLTDADFPSFAPGQADHFVRTDRAVMEAGTPALHVHEPMTVADGSTVWLETNKVPVRDAAGRVTGVLGTWEDITARKIAAEALGRSEARFHHTLEHMLEGCQIIGFDWRFLYVNASWEGQAGRPRAEVLGRTVLDAFPGLAGTPLLDAFRFGLEERRPYRFLNRFDRPDGTAGWFDLSIQPGPEGLFVLSADVTEQKRAEAALRESEERFRTLADTIPQLAWMAEPDGAIYWYNRRWYEYTGTTPEQMHGRGWEAVHDPAELPRVLAGFQLASAAGRAWEDTFPLRRHDGAMRWHLSRALPATDDRGAVVRWCGTNTDITDQRELAAELDRARADLENRVRSRTAELEATNRELEAFSYSVSHDLRSPLRAVDGFARILARDHGRLLPPPALDLVADVRAAAGRMNQLIDDLLAFSRLGRRPVRRQPVDVATLVRRCLAELPPAGDRRVEWHVDDLPPADADPALLKQVWLNLLGNALKYTAGRDPALIAVGGRSDPAGPTYFVRDNGTGFDMRHAGKLFGVFQRLHRADEFEGTGVGLAVVRRVVERHGGRVWAEAEPDNGATFFFTLPPAAAHPSAGGDIVGPGGGHSPAFPPAGRPSHDHDSHG